MTVSGPFLFFDTETTGLVNKKIKPADPSQPHLLQLAFVLASDAGEVMDRYSTLVQLPPGVESEPKALAAHGITGDKAREEGIPLWQALWEFERRIHACQTMVAHNTEFDVFLLRCAHAKIGFMHTLRDRPHYCTMKESTNICQVPSRNGGRGFKWPSLMEAHQHFLGVGFDGAHDALVDVEACMRVFFAMRTDKDA